MIDKGRATISIKRDVTIEWSNKITEELLFEMLSKAIFIAEQEDDYDAR